MLDDTLNLFPFDDNYIKSAMFFSLQKQNTIERQSPNSRGQFLTKYYKQHSREEKDKKINNLRQIYTSYVINWQQSYSSFLQNLTLNHNYYSLLLTLFEITEDPLWMNRINHICSLIQTLHNSCFDKKGTYLTEITLISNYENRLCRLFYLKNNNLQQHFKLLIMLFLNYNVKMQIFDTNSVALGLIHAGKHRSDGKLPEYLWIVSQLKVNKEVISSILKAIGQLLEGNSNISQQYISNCILPVMTIMSNYIYLQKEPFILDQLIQNKQFQILFMYGLKDINHPQICRQSLFLCNNLLAKSKQLSDKLIASSPVMLAASLIQCEQQSIFQQLLKLRGSEGVNVV